MIGLKRGTVKLIPYNPQYKDLFEEEKARLLKGLSSLVIDIQHIGSTSVPGIVSKPIIDIEAGIKDIGDLRKVEDIAKLLENLGFVWRRQNSHPNHHLFAKGPDDNRTHYLHLVEFEGEIWNNDLLFRNTLIKNPELAQEYEKLKIKLAERFPEDREKYTKGKKDFFNKVI